MLKKWAPLFFEAFDVKKNGKNGVSVSFEKIKTELYSETNLSRVRQIYYGINEVEYRVSLSKPLLMVENEVYFPGWRASLRSNEKTCEIQAISANDIFRAWLLPAGSYKMVARYEFPYAHIYNGIGVVSLIIWMLLLFRFELFWER